MHSTHDSDGPSLASATITLTNPQADDVLTFDGTPPASPVFGLGHSCQSRSRASRLSGSYQIALQQIRFSNGNIDPSNVTRTIEVIVSDGISNSNTATALVQVEAVNNSAPVIDLDPNDSGASTRSTFRTIFHGKRRRRHRSPIRIPPSPISTAPRLCPRRSRWRTSSPAIC